MNWVEENPDNIKKAEIIVGIPSYNEADLIAFPTQQASEGLTEYFADRSSVIINCDNASTDNTREAFLGTETEVPKMYISTPEGVKGKGNNFKNLFRKAVELKAKAIVVVDADLKSITPKWIKNLGEPLFMGYGYVAPVYIRHKYDGTITNNIAYPLSRSLYGRRIRQPIGGDFGFSGRLARVYHEHDGWQENVTQYGIDIWMTTLAMNHGGTLCQTFMGCPKIHRTKDPAKTLGPMFKHVIGTIFALMIDLESLWKRVVWSKPTPIFGFGLGENEAPPPVEVDEERLYSNLTDGFTAHRDTLEENLVPDVFGKLLEVSQTSPEIFEFPVSLWAKILFSVAAAFKKSPSQREALLEALIPLYFGRTYSYVKTTKWMETRQAEEYIEDQCNIFEETKPYLLKYWE